MVKVALIGCGRRGREHADILREAAGLTLAGVTNRHPQASQELAAAHGVPAFDSIGAMLETCRPEMVILATPVLGRSELVEQIAAFDSVRAILAEKPLALTLADARRMTELCAARDILLAIGHHWRFLDDVREMRRMLLAGDIGRVEFFRALSFGNWLDQGIHLLDAIRWCCGGARVQWAMAQACNEPDPLQRWGVALADARHDPTHPAPRWMTHHLALEGNVRVVLETGPLCQRSTDALDAWHERRILAVGSAGLLECRPGWWLREVSERQGVRRVESAAGSLRLATRRMHEAVRDALTEGQPYPHDARDALATLEGLALAAHSAQAGSLTTPPLDALRDYFCPSAPDSGAPASMPSRSTTGRLRFSVLIPLPEHRNIPLESVASWVSQQSFPRDRFEVLVMADGTEPALEEQVRARLGKADHFLRETGAHRSRLYDLGARAARGDILMFTESHCVAEPEFLTELERFFQNTSYDGACCRTLPVCANALARMDELLHEEGFRVYRQEGDWRKINVHACAIKRDAYLRAGGFVDGYGLFGEMPLAARLRDQGARLGYAAAPAVWHHYRPSLTEVRDAIAEFVRGESVYRQDHPGPDQLDFTVLQPQWDSVRQARLAGLLARTLGADLVKRSWWRFDFSTTRAWWRSLGKWLGDGPLASWRASLSLRWAMLRCHFWRWHPRRLERAYRDFWERSSRWARVKFLKALPMAEPALAPTQSSLGVTDLPEEAFCGLHPLESYQGRAFRWTDRAAVLLLPSMPAGGDVTIDTGNLRQDLGATDVRLFWNGRRVPAADVTFQDGLLRLSVPAGSEASDPSSLVLTCKPLQPWKAGVPDQRELGLAIFGIAMNATVLQRQAA